MPSRPISATDLQAAAREAAAVVARHADRADLERALPAEAAEAVVGAGFARRTARFGHRRRHEVRST